MKLFVPLDIETTGLNHKHDKILEISWVVTDDQFNELTERRSFIIDHKSEWGEVFSLLRSNEFVRRMHQDSGLAGDLLGEDGLPADEIADALYEDISSQEINDVESVHLLGFSIGFDREFLKAHPYFTKFFREFGSSGAFIHHRLMDLSSIKMMLEAAGIPIPKIENEGKHRALNDMVEALEFARAIRNDLIDNHLGTEI